MLPDVCLGAHLVVSLQPIDLAVLGVGVWQALAGHKRSFPLAVVLPPPARGPGTLIPSAQRFVWAAKQPLGNAALGALFA